jgi:dolichol-phosphate mannosyltransferase
MCTYNEADNIGSILAELWAYPVILIDSDSPDGTAQIASDFVNVEVHLKQNDGIASAYRQGLTRASLQNYDYIVQMDAGRTHPTSRILPMLLDAENTGAGLTIGSRFLHPHGWPSYRTAISLGAAWLMRRKGINVHDATSGFRVWRREWLQAALLRPNRARGFAFQLELLYNAHRAGAMIAEYPIPYRLTNSSFRWDMVAEALTIVGGME